MGIQPRATGGEGVAAIVQVQRDLDKAIEHHRKGEVETAEALYESIIKRAPRQPDALNLLGVLHSDRDRGEIAIELLKRASAARPKDATILNNLGNACMRAHRPEEAIEAFERALSLKPDLAEAYGNIIHAHRTSGNVDEAHWYIDRMAAQFGGSITAEIERARLLSDIGKKQEARAVFAKLIAENPNCIQAWCGLARVDKVRAGDPIIGHLLALIEKTPEPSVTVKALCFAAGKALDDIGDYDRAFENFARAKRQEPLTYDPKRAEAQFAGLKEVFTKKFFESRADYGVESEKPIFIVGMPRTGTTLTEQILASHPDVHGGGELGHIARAASQLAEFSSTDLRYPEAARAVNANAYGVTAHRYVRRLTALGGERARVTDKMPHNFLHLGLISLLYRNAKIIHCLRHPYDTCLSCYVLDFAHGHNYNQTLDGLAHYYNIYRNLMAHWEDVLPAPMFTMQYEETVADQARKTTELVEFVGLDWADSTLEFHKTERRVGTPSNWQVRQPIYSTSSGRWKNYERHLAPLMEKINQALLPNPKEIVSNL